MVSGWMAQASTISFHPGVLWHGFGQLTSDGLASGAVYALIAIGFTLVFGVLHLVDLTHPQVFMIGTFAAYLGLDASLGFGAAGRIYDKGVLLTVLYVGIAGVCAMAVSALAAVGVEMVAFRPLRKRGAQPLTFLIIALGMAFVIQEFVHRVLPVLAKGYGGGDPQRPIVLVRPTTLVTTGSFDIDGTRIPFPHANITNITVIIVVAALVLALITDWAINFTKFGRGIRAVAQDPETATLMGVSRERTILSTIIIGALLAGAAALLYTLKAPQAIVYSGGFLLGFKAFAAAILGRMGNVRGALFGGLILGLVEQYSQAFFGAQWIDAVAFVVLALVLMLRPTGLLSGSLERMPA